MLKRGCRTIMADEESSLTSIPPAPVTGEEKNVYSPRKHLPHKWHVDVLVNGHDVYHGYVKEVSMQGASLFLDHNLQGSKQIGLQIHIPPLTATEKLRVVEVTAKINSTIYDSDEDYFRTGINFIKFSSEADSAYLESRINNS